MVDRSKLAMRPLSERAVVEQARVADSHVLVDPNYCQVERYATAPVGRSRTDPACVAMAHSQAARVLRPEMTLECLEICAVPCTSCVQLSIDGTAVSIQLTVLPTFLAESRNAARVREA